MTPIKTIVLGMGNPILCDDAVGIRLARDFRTEAQEIPHVDYVVAGYFSGLNFQVAREAARRSSCANNLKQMGIVFKMYSNETKGGKFPPMSRVCNNWLLTKLPGNK